MSSFPGADEILDAYLDQVEALTVLPSKAAALVADPRSRFHGLAMEALEARLEADREQLDRWVVLMLVASFEATVRSDAKSRIAARTRHDVTRPLRDVCAEAEDRVRLLDLLTTWEAHATVKPTEKEAIRILLKHRHWLAHGQHWRNKYGPVPTPFEARADIEDYFAALRTGASDFPRA